MLHRDAIFKMNACKGLVACDCFQLSAVIHISGDRPKSNASSDIGFTSVDEGDRHLLFQRDSTNYPSNERNGWSA